MTPFPERHIQCAYPEEETHQTVTAWFVVALPQNQHDIRAFVPHGDVQFYRRAAVPVL